MPNAKLDVSRETLMRLEAFAALVLQWTQKINLISKKDQSDLWHRHIADSAQLFTLADTFDHWADFGSGGGFPVMVCAILAKEAASTAKFTLIESDHRKCTFLRTVSRKLDLPAVILNNRIEDVPPLGADLISARALAELDQLFAYAAPHLAPRGALLLPKGANWRSEDAAARKRWSYHMQPITSKTNPDAAILKIKDLTRV